MPKVFDSFVDAPPVSNGIYYAHIVTAVPTGTEVLVSALTIVNVAGYTDKDTIVSTVVDGAITNWDVNDLTWSALNFQVDLVGVVIIYQVGASKSSSVDKPFLFYEFENGLNTPIVLTPGYFGVKFSTGVNYALAVRQNNKYDVGSFVGYPFYKDLLTLLASNNGTRYTPVSALTNLQVFSASFGNYSPSFLAYWIGDRVRARELQDRHDLAHNNISFNLLVTPVLNFNSAATFNGVDSFVTIGSTTTNGADFTLISTSSNGQQLFLIYFQPTLNNTEEILLDTTTNNNSGGYIVRKTITNQIEIGFVTAGTPHTLVSFVSSNTLNIGAWNFVMFGSLSAARSLWLNDVRTLVTIATGFTSPTLTNGIRLGSRRGLASGLTGANFNGRIMYFASALGGTPDGAATMPAIVNRDAQAPYNAAYATGWSITGANVNTEMTTPNVFPANKSTFLRSIGNLATYAGAQNLATNGTVLSQVRIDQPDCFYVNFGQNRVRPGTIAIIFPIGNTLSGVKLDTAANSAMFSIWGTNTLPGNIPTNANLINPALWDKYELLISGINNTGISTDITGLSLVTSGGYRYYLLNTSIVKYYKYLKMGWKNAVTGSGGVSGYAHYLLYNSSVLTPNVDAVPLTVGSAG